MTIRLENLVIDSDGQNWLTSPADGMSVLYMPAYVPTILSMVRHIMRDESCTIIPVVRAAVLHPVNQYGHNFQVEVTYSRNGWRAIFAGRATANGRLTDVQCYMD